FHQHSSALHCDTLLLLCPRLRLYLASQPAGSATMGRFAQESHTDLREWYVHCLDFRTLKRRLIDDPPDPYDDHPSMAGPTEATAATASADARDPAPRSSSSSTASSGGGGGRGLLADPERDGLGASAPGEGNSGA
ncbi:unnamed protein product, partial [Laminaria digitata]